MVLLTTEKLFDIVVSVFNYGISSGTMDSPFFSDGLILTTISLPATADEYLVSGFSISIAGAPATIGVNTLDTLAVYNVPIVQAAPNITQGIYDWGTNYPDVINVTWDKDANGNLLISSEETFGTVDILADGLVSKSGWGSKFGTSFATPRVTAEITNEINDALIALESQGFSVNDVTEHHGIRY